MKNTNVVIINSQITGPQFDVHKAGCRDIKNNRWVQARATQVEQYDSVQAILDAYLDTGDENAPGWDSSEIRIMPCAQ